MFTVRNSQDTHIDMESVTSDKINDSMMHLLVIVSSDLFGLLARCSIKILRSNYTPQTKDKNYLSSYAFLSPLIGGPTPPLLSHTKAAYMYHEPCCSCIPLSFNVIQHAAIRSRSQEQHAATRTSLPSVLGAVRRPASFRCITPAASLRAETAANWFFTRWRASLTSRLCSLQSIQAC